MVVVERWEGKDGAVARCRAKAGEYGSAERASRSGTTGQAEQGCDFGGADKLLLGLADKVSKAGLRQREVQAQLELR